MKPIEGNSNPENTFTKPIIWISHNFWNVKHQYAGRIMDKKYIKFFLAFYVMILRLIKWRLMGFENKFASILQNY